MYHLPFQAVEIRFNYRMMWFTTGLAGFCLGMVNPFLPVLLTYDLYLLLRATQVMN